MELKANDVKPGLTGWAQINDRDELEIDVKAKLAGDYVEQESLLMDIKCFLGTIASVLSSVGVIAKAETVELGIYGTVTHKFKHKNVKNHKFSLFIFTCLYKKV